MEIVVKRLYMKPDYSIGRLWVDGVSFCDTMEPTSRHLNNHQTLVKIKQARKQGPMAVPTGRYRVLVTRSPKWGRWLPQPILVPGFWQVYLRQGNKPGETDGDILLGRNTRKGYLLDSTAHMLALQRKVTEAIGRGEEVWLTVKELRQ